MRILAVDDETLALNHMVSLLKRVLPLDEIQGFTKPAEAFAWLAEHGAEIAFLDIEMGGMNGIALAKKCKELCPEINIIFVTGYSQYLMDAFRIHASGYLMKPVRETDLRVEMQNLRHPVQRKKECRVRIQTFGSFEIFVDEKPLHMPGSKCRECLAYLVDRKGARATVAELASVLWEDRPYDKKVQNNTYRVISDTLRHLRQAGIESIVIKSRRDIAIDTEMVDCDYYRFLSGDVSQINAFFGEYMSNYDWAEFTLAGLAKTKASQNKK